VAVEPVVIEQVPQRTTGPGIPRGGMVKLTPTRGTPLTLIVDGAPDRSGGVGGWQSSERALRRPARWWQSPPEDTMSLPCIIDLYAIGGPSIERRVEVLYAMGQVDAEDDEEEPPVIRLSGDVVARDKTLRWVLQDIKLGERAWTSWGALRQQKLTLELEGYDGLDTIAPVAIKRTRSQGGTRRARVIVTQQGDTLRAIAVRQLGQSDAWKRVRDWNPKTFRTVKDPDAPLRAGLHVTLR
jgi:hypothetical protein